MGRLLCKKCERGLLNWIGNDDKMTFDESMARQIVCDRCGHIYEGMDGWSDYQKAMDEAGIDYKSAGIQEGRE